MPFTYVIAFAHTNSKERYVYLIFKYKIGGIFLLLLLLENEPPPPHTHIKMPPKVKITHCK